MYERCTYCRASAIAKDMGQVDPDDAVAAYLRIEPIMLCRPCAQEHIHNIRPETTR